MKLFITGVSSGIGRALAKKLIAHGHTIWGIARREHLLQQLAAETDNDRFKYSRCDVSNPSDVRNVVFKMQSLDFLPDAVVLNAAVEREEPYPDFNMENARFILRTNMEGSLTWISRFIQPFLERGSGQFVYISSLFALWPDPSCPAYAAGKAGMSMAFRSLSSRYATSGIQFKLVYLGSVNTAINPRFKNTSKDNQPFYVAKTDDVASHLSKIIGSKGNIFCYPFYMAVLFSCFRWLPDSLFDWIFSRFKR